MNRLHSLRCSLTLASLALFVAPLGCGSDTTAPPSAESPALNPPVVVTDTQNGFAPTPLPGTPPGAYTEPPAAVDHDVRQAAGEVKQEARADAAEARKEAREAEGDAKKAVNDIEDEAKRKARELEGDARKSAEDALNRLLPAPK